MRRIIVDYAKLTGDILNLLVEKFPEGYDDSDIIRFRNAQNELIEAVEVRTVDTIYLVKVSTKVLLKTRRVRIDSDYLASTLNSTLRFISRPPVSSSLDTRGFSSP